MTQPYGYPSPEPYAQPAAPYPPQAPAYPAPYPPQAAPPGYAPGYPAPAPPGYGTAQPAPQPLARGTIDDFLSQPGGSGGESLTKVFAGKAPGAVTVTFLVARTVTNADIRQQTDAQGRAATGFDGRPLYVMIVPCQVTGSTDGCHAALFPDGHAAWWLKGQAKDALAQAMSAAGAPDGVPEAGARIDLTWTGDRPARRAGHNPSKQYRVVYTRPASAPGQPQPALDAAALAPQPPAAPPAPFPPVPQYAPQAAPAAQYAPVAAPPAAPYPPQAYAPPAAPSAPPAAPVIPGLTDEQARLMELLRANGAIPAAPAA